MAETAGNRWLETYVPYQLYRVTNRLNGRLQSRLRIMKISASQWRVLSVLRSFGQLNIGKIVEHTLMEQPTVSRVVGQLEADGMVVRESSRADSRVTEVSLTLKGEAAFNALVDAAHRHEEMALKGLTRKELDGLREVLTKIENNIDFYE